MFVHVTKNDRDGEIEGEKGRRMQAKREGERKLRVCQLVKEHGY